VDDVPRSAPERLGRGAAGYVLLGLLLVFSFFSAYGYALSQRAAGHVADAAVVGARTPVTQLRLTPVVSRTASFAATCPATTCPDGTACQAAGGGACPMTPGAAGEPSACPMGAAAAAACCQQGGPR
jgi:hypothetical protein